jgi:hypothetical protein
MTENMHTEIVVNNAISTEKGHSRRQTTKILSKTEVGKQNSFS